MLMMSGKCKHKNILNKARWGFRFGYNSRMRVYQYKTVCLDCGKEITEWKDMIVEPITENSSIDFVILGEMLDENKEVWYKESIKEI